MVVVSTLRPARASVAFLFLPVCFLNLSLFLPQLTVDGLAVVDDLRCFAPHSRHRRHPWFTRWRRLKCRGWRRLRAPPTARNRWRHRRRCLWGCCPLCATAAAAPSRGARCTTTALRRPCYCRAQPIGAGRWSRRSRPPRRSLLGSNCRSPCGANIKNKNVWWPLCGRSKPAGRLDPPTMSWRASVARCPLPVARYRRWLWFDIDTVVVVCVGCRAEQWGGTMASQALAAFLVCPSSCCGSYACTRTPAPHYTHTHTHTHTHGSFVCDCGRATTLNPTTQPAPTPAYPGKRLVLKRLAACGSKPRATKCWTKN